MSSIEHCFERRKGNKTFKDGRIKKIECVSHSNGSVRQAPDRSIRLPDRPRSFNNLGPVRLNLVYC